MCTGTVNSHWKLQIWGKLSLDFQRKASQYFVFIVRRWLIDSDQLAIARYSFLITRSQSTIAPVPPETEFVCASAEYFYDEAECRLSRDTRRSQPAAFRCVLLSAVTRAAAISNTRPGPARRTWTTWRTSACGSGGRSTASSSSTPTRTSATRTSSCRPGVQRRWGLTFRSQTG